MHFVTYNSSYFLIKSLLKILLILYALPMFSQGELNADFDLAENTSGCAPFIVSFIDISSGGDSNNLSFYWDFGNGMSSNEQNPTHIYSQPGFYTVSFTVNDGSNSDTETKYSLIRVNPPPIADFTVNNQTGCSPHSSEFTDLSIPTSGTITDWFWAFGNGETSFEQNPTVVYTEIKNYNVFLKVVDINGCEASTSKSNYIKLDGPVANFLYDSVVCGLPANVTFLNQSTGNELDYFWDFGDGTTSTGDVPGTHVYTAFDSTKVTLIVTERNTGCSDTLSSSLVVGNYEAEFDWDIECGNNEFTINVENKTSVYNTLKWDFGGESIAFTSNASHNFSSKGPYEITLTTTIDPSCWDTTTIQYNLPIANISYDASICSYPFEVAFKNQSSAKNFQSFWEFGDSTSSTQNEPIHIYTIPPEMFLSKLLIEDSFGCVDSAQQYVTVPFPIARFYELNSKHTGCSPLNLTFKDTSYTLGSNISAVEWNFGDSLSGNNNFSTDSNPSHTYNTPGIYDITYIIFTEDGCSDTAVYEGIVKVGERPESATFEQLFNDSICYGESIQFIESATYSTTAIESNYFCWAFEEGSDSLLLNSETPPEDCPEKPEFSNNNNPFINFSQPTHIYSEFNHIADTSNSNVSTGEIIPNAGNLYTHLFIGYNNCLTEIIQPTFVDTTIAVNGYVLNDSVELFSDSTLQVGLYQASINYDSIAYSYVYTNSLSDTLVKIHPTDTIYLSFKEGEKYKIRTKIINKTSGCSNEITDVFTVDSTRLNFEIINKTCLNQNPVLFADNSFSKYGNINQRKWFVNNNLVATIKNNNSIDSFYYSFPDTGIFTVKLLVEFSIQYQKYGQWKTGVFFKQTSKQIKLEGVKAKGFSDTLQSCGGDKIQFNDTSSSTGEIKEYLWIFGDETANSNLKNPNHEYLNAGNYTPSLVVTDTFGCVDSVALDEIVVLKPNIDFTSSDSLVCKGDVVSFDNKSSGNSLSFVWTIDSTAQYITNIEYQFDSAGFFDVKLYAIDTFNCADSLTKNNLIEVSRIPKPEFTATTLQTGCPPMSTNFSDTTGGTITKWLWNFGDGNQRTDKDPTHIFTNPGNYDISLIVTNYANCSDTIVKQKYINVGGPYGEVVYSSDTICIPEKIEFNLNLNNTKYYVLDYGDENKLSYTYTENPDSTNHIYTQGGIHQPIVELIDSLGCLYKLPELPKIYGDSLNADFKTTSEIICDLNNVSFLNKSRSTFESQFLWSFGNNDSSTLISPIYNYEKDSIYEVSLKQISPLGCIDSMNQTIQVFSAPSPILSIYNESFCIPSETNLKLKFENDEFNFDSIYFLINDTLQLLGDSIVNIFLEKGAQNIKYFIKYGDGACLLDSSFSLSFFEKPKANFEFSPENSSLEEPVIYFKDKSENATFWNWTFDEFGSSSYQNPVYSYETADSYTVKLVVSNPGGCSDSITHKVIVSPYNFINLPSGFSPNGDGKNETFGILKAGNIELLEFKIYNRWGNLVFSTTNPDEAWDGKRKGKDQNTGTYIYYVKGRKNSGEITEVKGSFTLIR